MKKKEQWPGASSKITKLVVGLVSFRYYKDHRVRMMLYQYSPSLMSKWEEDAKKVKMVKKGHLKSSPILVCSSDANRFQLLCGNTYPCTPPYPPLWLIYASAWVERQKAQRRIHLSASSNSPHPCALSNSGDEAAQAGKPPKAST